MEKAKKTKYEFKCDSNVAQNIINQFLQANNYKQKTNSNGLTYYKFSDAIAVGFLEYECNNGLVTLTAYIRSEKRPMPLDNSFVGSIPKSHYKSVIAPLLKALSDASSQNSNNTSNVDEQAIDSNSTNSESNQTQNNSTTMTNDSYNQFVEQNQSTKEKFAIAAFVMSLVGLLLSFFSFIYGWIIIFLEYYFAIQGLKTKKRGLAIAAIVLASVSIFIDIIWIILSVMLL